MPKNKAYIIRFLQLGTLVVVAGLAHWFGYQKGVDSKTGAPGEPAATPHSNEPIASRQIIEETEQPITLVPIVQTEEVDTLKIQGHEAATSGLPIPFDLLATLTLSEQRSFLSGYIAEIATSLSPHTALGIVKDDRLGDLKAAALKILAAEWIVKNSQLNIEDAEKSAKRILGTSRTQYGLEVDLGLSLARAGADEFVTRAWMDAHASHPGRSKLFASLNADQFRKDPLSVMQQTSGWTDWEQKQYEKNLFKDWARSEPDNALDWYAQNGQFLDDSIGTVILDTLSRQDPKIASTLLPSIKDQAQRQESIANLATRIAKNSTEDALAWVDSLPDQQDRDAALQAVYAATPKGIGAMLGQQDGFPVIKELIPGGPLETSGLRPGDLIVQAQEGFGTPSDFHGSSLRIVPKLRGEPGSEVQIRVLRENPETSQIEERSVTIRRDLLPIDRDD